ncbi:hypothetical protein ASF70_18970 [Rhizobium sp. Leaf321]|uniref:phage tail tip fiber protein n=1 Tax=Rhizobium sp. Leaf321 TaxID=1736335 RepID=UPI0007162E49|nr:DUF1983 domain-containing protein [Rhizobium sp. Leaf321]KQQ70927.1 hypothetical protein ASF70_18970 [Rhizobium sp. Leaf321]
MPFISAVVGAIGGIIGLGSVGVSLASAAIGIGLNFVAAKIQASRAKKASKQASGTQFDKEYGENVSRKVPCGLVGLAGHDCYVNTYGTSNKYLEQIYVLSDFPCDGLSKIWAGGKQLKLLSTDNKNYTVDGGDYEGRMSFVFYDGTQTAADQGLVTNSNPVDRWKSVNVGSGICYLIVRLTYDQEKLAQFPEFFFEIRGARLYDFRRDSSIGGSGAHRFGQYGTYEFSENPIVQDYNYRRGFSWNGDLFLGMDMAEADLPFDRYVVAANLCDEIVDGEPRYRCSIIFDADVDHGDNIDAVMTSCGGIVVDGVEGSWPIIGSVQPIVETFTDDDLITTEPVSFQRRRSMAELTNSVSGTYLDPGNLWSPVGYDQQSNPTQVSLDRRTRDVQINFDTVRSKRQANQLASIYYNENRYEATADIVLRPRFQTVKVGDWVRWNSARYGDRVYIVRSRSIRALTSDGPRNVVLSLQERDAAIYAKAGLVAPVVPIPNGDPVYLNELQDWAIIAVVATGADGRSYPAFRLSWSPIDDVTVQAVVFEWWVDGAPQNKFRRRVEADETIALVQEGILSVTDYKFRHKLVADRATSWVGPVSATSIEGGSSFLVDLENLSEDIQQKLAELQDWIDDGLKDTVDETVVNLSKEIDGRVAGAIESATRYRSIVSEIAAIRDFTAEQDFANYRDKEQLRQTLTVRLEGGFATFDERITTAVSATSAVAQRVTTLEVGSGNLAAQITQIEQASIVGDLALAQQISLLSAGTDNQFDPVNLWDFETDVSGWTGNGAPTVASGFLRPANVANDPYVASPTIEVMASKYRQVRLRVRKFGSPVWEGYCWWKTSTDTTWDTARRTVVAAPNFDANGIGLITFNPEWSGSIAQIRIDLSTAQTATDYFTIDWISVGAPSPGASRAELAAERLARITDDDALASDIVALDAAFNDPATGLGAVASGVTALEGRVTSIDGLLTAQGSSLAALSVSLDGKAGLDVVNALSAEVAAIGGGGLTAQGSDIRAIRNSIWPIASETLDQDFANFLGKMDSLKVTANAADTLDTRITLTNDSIEIVSRAVTQVQSILPGLASSTALTALSTRVTAAEGNISTSSGSITSLRSDLGSLEGVVGTKASATALTALTTRVSSAEGQISSISDSVTKVTSRVDDVSADATFRMTTAVGPSGFARIAAQARASTGDSFRTAGWFMDVPTDPSQPTQFLVTADRFAILNGSSKKQPFVFEGGELVLAIANIGLITAGTIEIGKTRIDSNGITVSS